MFRWFSEASVWGPRFGSRVSSFLPSFGSRFAEASIGGWIPKIQGDKLGSIRIQYPHSWLGDGEWWWALQSEVVLLFFFGKWWKIKKNVQIGNWCFFWRWKLLMLLRCIWFMIIFSWTAATFVDAVHSEAGTKRGSQESLAGPNNWNTRWELICSGSFVAMAFPTHGFRWQWLIMHLRSDRRLSIDPSLDFRLIKSLSMTESNKRKVGKMIFGFLSRKWLISTRNHGLFLACRQ